MKKIEEKEEQTSRRVLSVRQKCLENEREKEWNLFDKSVCLVCMIEVDEKKKEEKVVVEKEKEEWEQQAERRW